MSQASQRPHGSEPDPIRDASLVRRLLSVACVLAVYFVIQSLTGILAIWPRLERSEEYGHGSWVQLLDHHLWQMVLALGLIGLLGRGRWDEWGLTLRNRAESLRIARRFVRVYGLYFLGIGFLVQLVLGASPAPPGGLELEHVVGRLAFGFILVGLSEEILFRGLFHTWLARHWRRTARWGRFEMPTAGVIAALVFTLAHINFRLVPFEVTHISLPQVAMAAALGSFYSWAYHRTQSLLAPILAHNFSDGALWATEYLLLWMR